MYTKTAIISLLAATAIAAPAKLRRDYDNTIRVTLGDDAGNGAVVQLNEGSRSNALATADTSGPFTFIEISVGQNVVQQDVRCQVLDHMGVPIVATRGENVDITFSDADKGAWTFRDGAQTVSEVICDPAFAKIDPSSPELSLTVVLQSQSTETGSQTVLPSGARALSAPVGSAGPYETVELRAGALVDPAYRCQILDHQGEPLIVLRGANRDITFSDADKGEWTLEHPATVSEIVCDPSFVAQKL